MGKQRQAKRIKCRDCGESASTYKSPLKCFEKSLNRLIDSNDNVMNKGKRRESPRLKKRNASISLNVDSPLQNSIIVISDSESEMSNNADTLNNIECSPNIRRTRRQRSQMLNKVLNDSCKQNKRSSVIVVDDDVSFVNITNIQNVSCDIIDTNEENRVPPPSEDVVELSSNVANSSRDQDASKQCKRKVRTENQNLFKIDTRPNFDNLKYLKKQEALAKKRQRVHHDSNPSETHETKRLKYDKNLKSTSVQLRKNKTRKVEKEKNDKHNNLRKIIVDGCNVAMAHTNGRIFSEKGIELVLDYFQERGHEVKVFLPQHIRRRHYQFLEELYKIGIVVFTPSRFIAGRQITSYDDRYILEYATKCEGIVISSDQYRDLYEEKPEWRGTIVNRLLSPTFVGDFVMFPEDPLGKKGPDLDTFLRY